MAVTDFPYLKAIISEATMKKAGVRTRNSSNALTVTAPYEYNFSLNYPYNSKEDAKLSSSYLKDNSGTSTYNGLNGWGLENVGLPTGITFNFDKTLWDSSTSGSKAIAGTYQIYTYPYFSNHELGTYNTTHEVTHEVVKTATYNIFTASPTVGETSNTSPGKIYVPRDIINLNTDDYGIYATGLNSNVLSSIKNRKILSNKKYYEDDDCYTVNGSWSDFTRCFIQISRNSGFINTKKTKTINFNSFVPNSYRDLPNFQVNKVTFSIVPYTFTITSLQGDGQDITDVCMEKEGKWWNGNRFWNLKKDSSFLSINTTFTTTKGAQNNATTLCMYVGCDASEKTSTTTAVAATTYNDAAWEWKMLPYWDDNGNCKLDIPYGIFADGNPAGEYGVIGYALYNVSISYSYTESTTDTVIDNVKYKDAADYLHWNFNKHQLITSFNLYEEHTSPYNQNWGSGYAVWCDGSGPITVRDNGSEPHIPTYISYLRTYSGGSTGWDHIAIIGRGNSTSYDGYNMRGLYYIPYYGFAQWVHSSSKVLNRTSEYSAYDIKPFIYTYSSTMTPLKDNCITIKEVSVPFSIYAGKGVSSSAKIADYTIKLPQINSIIAQVGPYGGYSKVCWVNHAKAISSIKAKLVNCSAYDFQVTAKVYGNTTGTYTVTSSDTDITMSNDSYLTYYSMTGTSGSDVYTELKSGSGTIRLSFTTNDNSNQNKNQTLTADIPFSGSYYQHVSAFPVALFYNSSQGITWTNASFSTNTSSLTSATSSSWTTSIYNSSYTFVKGTSINSCSMKRSYISSSYSNYKRYYYRSRVVYNIGNGTDYTLQTGSYTYYTPDSGETVTLSPSSISMICSKIGQSTSSGLNLLFNIDMGTFQPPTVQQCSDAGSWKRSCKVYNPNPVSLTMKYSSNKTKNKYSCNSSTATTTISAYGTTYVTIQDQSGYDDEWILFAFDCNREYCYRTIDEDVSSSPNTVATGWSSSV